MAYPGKHPERVAIAVAGTHAGIARCLGDARARLADAEAAARLRLGRAVQGLVQLGLFHAGKEVERRIVLAHVGQAEIVILDLATLALAGLGRAMGTGGLAAVPVTLDGCLGRLFFPTRLDADGIEELGSQFQYA